MLSKIINSIIPEEKNESEEQLKQSRATKDTPPREPSQNISFFPPKSWEPAEQPHFSVDQSLNDILKDKKQNVPRQRESLGLNEPLDFGQLSEKQNPRHQERIKGLKKSRRKLNKQLDLAKGPELLTDEAIISQQLLEISADNLTGSAKKKSNSDLVSSEESLRPGSGLNALNINKLPSDNSALTQPPMHEYENFSMMTDDEYRNTLNQTILIQECLQHQAETQSTQPDEDLQQNQSFNWERISYQLEPLSEKDLAQIRNQVIHSTKSLISRRTRGALWVKLFNVEEVQANFSHQMYGKLLEMPNEEADDIISRDVSRTLSDLGLWHEDLKCGNNKLFNVLKAYANYDNEVGYVQGLNYVVGMMLYFVGDEETAFWCLHNLMQGKWAWRWIYVRELPKLQKLLRLLDERLLVEFPQVHWHLNDNYILVDGVFSPLFVTLFVYQTPFEVASRLFELFLLDGEMVLIRLTLKMIELNEKRILSLRDLELQKFMQRGMVIESTRKYPLAKLLS